MRRVNENVWPNPQTVNLNHKTRSKIYYENMLSEALSPSKGLRIIKENGQSVHLELQSRK